MNPSVSEERQHFNLTTSQLDELVTRSWHSIDELTQIALELPYRERLAAKRLRQRTLERMVEILESRQDFIWPNTDAPEGFTKLDQEVFRHDHSPLKAMGYSVGVNGPTSEGRQAILDDAYLGVLPPVNSSEYMRAWGDADTATRLKKMADLIATSARLKKRQDSETFRLAISEWEEDLAHLKQKYYDGRYDAAMSFFAWPDTAFC